MRPTLKIPYELDTSSGTLQRELDRLVTGLYDYAESVRQLNDVKPEITRSIVRSGTCAAAYDTLLRVQPFDDTTVTVQLPRPNTKEGGLTLRVARLNYAGAIVLTPIGDALINEAPQLVMYATPGLIEVLFDGQNFYSDYQGAFAWGEGL